MSPNLPFSYPVHRVVLTDDCNNDDLHDFAPCPSCGYDWTQLNAETRREMSSNQSLNNINTPSDGLVIQTPRWAYPDPEKEGDVWTCYNITFLAANLASLRYQSVDDWLHRIPSGMTFSFASSELEALLTAFIKLGPTDAGMLREALTKDDGTLGPVYLNIEQSYEEDLDAGSEDGARSESGSEGDGGQDL